MSCQIASLKSAVGSYDDAALLDDISSMVAIVQNSNLVAAILDRDNMASIQETAEWIFQVVKFVQGLMGDGQFSSQSCVAFINSLFLLTDFFFLQIGRYGYFTC